MERRLFGVLVDEEVLQGFRPVAVPIVVALHLDAIMGRPYHGMRRVHCPVLDSVIVPVPLSVIGLGEHRYREVFLPSMRVTAAWQVAPGVSGKVIVTVPSPVDISFLMTV